MNMATKKILMANAFYLKNDNKQLKEKYRPYAPLATLYGASTLRNNGYDINVFDAVLSENITEFYQVFTSYSPSVLVIYEDDFNFLTKMCLSHVRETTLKMLDYIKAYDITVIVHSSDASDSPEFYLDNGANYIIYGEGERTLADLVEYCYAGNIDPPEDIPGICFFYNGELRKTSTRRTLRQLDDLPQPAWDLIDFDKYRSAWQQKHGYFSINMVTTRGCPYKCNWCAKPIWGQQYNTHSPEYMATQLQWLVANVSPDHVWFADDIFGLKPGWIEAFADSVNRLNIKVPFMIQSRADLIDGHATDALKRAGCNEVWLGVESGSQTVLDNMEKGINMQQVRHARMLLAESGIKAGFFIQLGYPGEDIEDIERTRMMILQLKPDYIGVSVSYPLPGTQFYQRVKDQITDKTHWWESNDLDTVFQSTFKAEYYRLIRDHLHEELLCHHTNTNDGSWDCKWQALKSLAEQYRNLRPTQISSAFDSLEHDGSSDQYQSERYCPH